MAATSCATGCAIIRNESIHTGGSQWLIQIEQATAAMRNSVDAVHEAADDQQMLVGIVMSRIAENDAHTDSAAQHTTACIADADRMVEAARSLNDTTHKFVV